VTKRICLSGNDCRQVLLDPAAIGAIRVDDKSIADMRALEVGNVGENIAVRRAMYLSAANDKQHVASYVHSTGCTLCLIYRYVNCKYSVLNG
jgi:translation elongation factor EF-Ts